MLVPLKPLPLCQVGYTLRWFVYTCVLERWELVLQAPGVAENTYAEAVESMKTLGLRTQDACIPTLPVIEFGTFSID